ncbi:hypothetical protein KJ975_01535 [Myxococcota bacterium]|nr:hypothetical protein [Myxococcota bacterium]
MLFTPFGTEPELLIITPALAVEARLGEWGAGFALGTAGYRDLLDPQDFFSPKVPLSALTMGIIATARVDVARKHGITSLHIGGEVRPHTQKFIDLCARIYAAAGLTVHLQGGSARTTPIWMSSFGVFHYGLGGGENFTASHSQSYKGGWKPMDEHGMQLLGMAGEIQARVRELTSTICTDGLEISLASAHDPHIRHDFDPLPAYVESLGKLMDPAGIDTIRQALIGGLKVAICTEGGSMGAAARRIFGMLDFPMDDRGITFLFEAESEDYHGIGQLDGVNHGVDPGKWQIYKHIGAQDLLAQGAADIVFIWDPDGDRFNIVTTAPAALADRARDAALEVDPLDETNCLVYFKPNQIYFLLTALRMQALGEAGLLDKYDFVAAITYPTSRSILAVAERIASEHGARIGTVLVPVGFKYFGELVASVQRQLLEGAVEVTFTEATGRVRQLGHKPRFLMMAEESGGAAMGTLDWVKNHDTSSASLALKEKDGFQVGLFTLLAAARLHKTGYSFAQWYMDLLARYPIPYAAYERQDITLYDESLQGDARRAAQQAANVHKESLVSYFRGLTVMTPEAATSRLRTDLKDPDFPAIHNAFWAQDGSFLEFDGAWFELRASGTDAVLRYYFEGSDPKTVHRLNSALVALRA